MNVDILTVGHSNHSMDYFIQLLRKNGVNAIADVRSSPYSRFAPQFNKGEISDSLKLHGISYVYLGKELGARSEDDCCYVNDVVSYDLIAETDVFKAGISRLIAGSTKLRIAAMCSEREPTECHRTILVARVLSDHGLKVGHILEDGSVEDHRSTMVRLLGILGLPSFDLLMTTDRLIEEAYKGREKQIAYRRTRAAV